jgi:hypothetical protein
MSGLYEDCQENLGSKVQSDAESTGDSAQILLFSEGSSQQDCLSPSVRTDRRATGTVSGDSQDSAQTRSLHSEHEALLADAQRQGDQSQERQALPAIRKREIFETQNRDKAQTPNKVSELHPDSPGMDPGKRSVSTSVQILREAIPEARNGSRSASVERGASCEGEYRSGVPELQRPQGQQMRNRRTVWTIATQPYGDAHFAMFPEELPKLCILAGSKPGDTVLDLFAGSGTTGKVALELGRKAILIELNPAYVDLAQARCNVTPGWY